VATPTVVNPAPAASPLLTIVTYNPASPTVTQTSSSTYAAIDSTHLSATFTAPASGNVTIELEAYGVGSSGASLLQWGVGPHGGVVTPSTEVGITTDNDGGRWHVTCYLTGLTPGTSYTYDWFHATGNNGTAVSTKYGASAGANNTIGPAIMKVLAA
jgi:hypothetical protein